MSKPCLPLKRLVTILALLVPFCLFAQTERPWEDVLDRVAQTEDIDDGSLEQLYDELADIAATKIDINTCTRGQLEQLPFLTAQQVMDIIEYRDMAGRMETSMELYLVPSLDRETILLLRQFITFSPQPSGDTIPSLRKVLRYGKNTLLADLHIPLYERQGDRKGYLGYKYKHWLRYSFNYGQQVRFGITASQDAGEPFFAGRNKTGYDFYSAYLLARDMGRLKALALGRYRLRFGMGLVVNNGYGFGKLATLSALVSSSSHIFAHSSRSEGNYLQGGAATVTLAKGLDLTAFASYRKIDATLAKDSASVVTILTTGYHRTHSEMERRRNTGETLLGGNLNFFKNGFHVGLTGCYTHFDRRLMMNNGQLYRRWYPVGSSFGNVSIDYGYLSNRLNISGETAIDDNGQVATINTISYELSSRLTLAALQRYYPYRYQAFFAKSFAEGGRVNDESGVFVGGKWLPWIGGVLTFYTDISYYAWPKYRASQSSHRWDNCVQMDAGSESWKVLLRYRLKMKEEDGDDGALAKHYEHRARASMTYSGRSLSLRSQADFSATRSDGWSRGYMLSEMASWQWRWLLARGSVGYFHTDDYSSRVYSHEPGLLYTFFFPSFYGHGMRYSLCLRAAVGDKLLFIAKGGMTHYFDRSTISSGLQQIDSSTQSDIEMQLRWKF